MKSFPGTPRVLLVLCAGLPLCHGANLKAAETPRWVGVAGHQVNVERMAASEVAGTVSNLRHQIGVIDAIKLPEEVRSFFRTVEIVIDPSLTGMNGQYVEIGGKWVIRARPGRWPQDRAILLHELLHAYHHKVLGQPTPPVGRALGEALREGTYPPDYQGAHFLSNGREYFAVVAEIYLAGTSFRPPYSCANVKKVQPGFISYLDSLFGARECK